LQITNILKSTMPINVISNYDATATGTIYPSHQVKLTK